MTDDKHPARHFTANLSVGYFMGGGISKAAAWSREIFSPTGGTYKDVKLGLLGAKVGQMLTDGKIKKEEIGEWIRKNL